MSIPLIPGLLFLIGFVADIVGRSTPLPRVTFLLMIAIGMALVATQRFPETASVVLTAAVASTVVLETVGPILTRLAIRRATTADDV